MNNCLIHYFSGTGGTNDAVKKIGNILMKNNYTVEYCNIEKDNIEKMVFSILEVLPDAYIVSVINRVFKNFREFQNRSFFNTEIQSILVEKG